MLRQQSLNAAYESADRLTQADLLVSPVAGSPLEELSRLSMPTEVIGLGPVNGEAQYGDCIAYSLTKDVLGGCPHDETMERFVTLAGDIVTSNLNLARNVANPIIKKVVEDATAYAEAKSRSSMSPMNVVPDTYPAPYNSPILAELVGKYSDTMNTDMKLSIIFPVMSADQIRASCMTGVSRLDTEIQAWLADQTDEWVEGTYNEVFGEKAPTLTAALSDLRSRPAKALLVFLVARRLMDDIPDGVNSELGIYREYMSGLMSQAGRQVVNAIRRRGENDKSNYMLISYPQGENTLSGVPEGAVRVNADVYTRWLKEGGSPEMIFGALHSGSDNLSYQGLLDSGEKHVTTWRRACGLLKTRSDYERFNHFLEGMRVALLAQIGKLAPEIRSFTDQSYKERITEHLIKVKEGGVDEPWAIARKLVCRVFFPHTECERVLWAIATSCKNNPELDVREAALLATIEIVSLWVAQQFTVDSANSMG